VITSDYSAGEWAHTSARLTKVPLGVDLTTFTPDAGLPEEDGVLKLIYVGRMSREKSPQLGVAAAVELHRRGIPLRLRMIGTGPHLGELRRIAGDAPVRFEGYVDDRSEIAAAYASSDISLSVCPAETFGLAVLEALSSGTPVVTANAGGGRELVDPTCAEWGDPEPTAIADAIERLAARRHARPSPSASLQPARQLIPWAPGWAVPTSVPLASSTPPPTSAPGWTSTMRPRPNCGWASTSATSPLAG
jgi:alpha-1,6-mannosyltransferase